MTKSLPDILSEVGRDTYDAWQHTCLIEMNRTPSLIRDVEGRKKYARQYIERRYDQWKHDVKGEDPARQRWEGE